MENLRDFSVLERIKSCLKFSPVLKLALVTVSLFMQDGSKGNVLILLASLQKLTLGLGKVRCGKAK